MDFAQLVDILIKGGAGLFTVALAFAVYTLWTKLQEEQLHSRSRDEQIALLLQKISESLTTINNEVRELKKTIIDHLLNFTDQIGDK